MEGKRVKYSRRKKRNETNDGNHQQQRVKKITWKDTVCLGWVWWDCGGMEKGRKNEGKRKKSFDSRDAQLWLQVSHVSQVKGNNSSQWQILQDSLPEINGPITHSVTHEACFVVTNTTQLVERLEACLDSIWTGEREREKWMRRDLMSERERERSVSCSQLLLVCHSRFGQVNNQRERERERRIEWQEGRKERELKSGRFFCSQSPVGSWKRQEIGQ